MPAFLDIFTDCVIVLNSQLDEPKAPGSAKTVTTKGNLSEWFLKFTEKVKDIVSKTNKEPNWTEVSYSAFVQSF